MGQEGKRDMCSGGYLHAPLLHRACCHPSTEQQWLLQPRPIHTQTDWAAATLEQGPFKSALKAIWMGTLGHSGGGPRMLSCLDGFHGGRPEAIPRLAQRAHLTTTREKSENAWWKKE